MLAGEAITGAKAMGARIDFSLSVEARKGLERIVRRGQNWRERERAQTLLLLGAGVFAEDVASQLDLNLRTVRTTRSQWLDSGLASLPDRPRCGAPRKLAPEHVQRLLAWAQAEPLTATALLARHCDGGGPSVHTNTLAATLKAEGLVWKRTRHTLKKTATRSPSGKAR